MTYFWIAMLGIYGLMAGSFINAYVWRFHERHDENLKPKRMSAKKRAQLSITTGRSMCPACKHQLAVRDLLPVVSWVWLRGKCRYCQVSISKQYPVVELVTALLFVVSFIVWPTELVGINIVLFVLWLVVVGFFVTLTVYDTRWQLLPDKIVYPLVGVSALYASLQLLGTSNLVGEMVGYAGGVIVCSGLFYGLYQLSDGRWIGGGDVKLGIALGLLAGSFMSGLLLISLASFIGVIISAPLLITKNLAIKSRIAFGPMLMLACYIVVIWGESIIQWYNTNVLYI